MFGFALFNLGFLCGGVVGIVSATICADLGKIRQLNLNERALATVTGIVDGTGNIGSSLG